jgi:beta-lactamase superfamily II metal-dependent hydrolase
MVHVELLPAAHGDAIWIEYGDGSDRHRILIDGGPAHTYQAGLRARIRGLPEDDRHFDLFVISHIDADHIDGAIIFLQEAQLLKATFGQIWFNAWRQLEKTGPDTFAPLQGEFLGALIKTTPDFEQRWNKEFAGKAVVVPESGKLPVVPLPGGARLTLLSPRQRDLKRLRARWNSAIRDFSPGDEEQAKRRLNERRAYRPPQAPAVFAVPSYGDDHAVANGSSIAFLLDIGDVRLLLGADAHAATLTESLRQLAKDAGVSRIRVDAVKLPHHGSMGNVTSDLLSTIESECWLVSTNGAIFDHPDWETAALIEQTQPQLPEMLCNYDVPFTRRRPAGGEDVEKKWRAFPPGQGETTAGPEGGLVVTFPRSGLAVPTTAQPVMPATAQPAAPAPKQPTGRRRSPAAGGRRKTRKA